MISSIHQEFQKSLHMTNSLILFHRMIESTPNWHDIQKQLVELVNLMERDTTFADMTFKILSAVYRLFRAIERHLCIESVLTTDIHDKMNAIMIKILAVSLTYDPLRDVKIDHSERKIIDQTFLNANWFRKTWVKLL